MSWYVMLSIGGEGSHADLLRLFSEAADLGLLVAASDVHAATLLDAADRRLRPSDVDDLVLPDLTLGFVAPDFGSDSFDPLEDTCQELGLPYVRKVDGDSEADGFSVWWTPGMDGTGECQTDHDDRAMLSVSEVREALAAGTLEQLIAESEIPELPAFTVRP